MDRVSEYRPGVPAAALLAGLAAAFFAWYPVSDGDIFWHLAAGREIAASGAVPHSDPFSFTSQPEWRWTDLHWLYQLCMHGIHYAAGLWGIVAANSLLFGLSAALLFLSISPRGAAAWLALFLWLAALYEVRYLVPHRPVVFSLLFFAAFFFCLERYRRGGRSRFLYALPLLQVVWVNCQPLFILGPTLFGLWYAGEWAGRLLKRGGDAGTVAATRPLPVVVTGLLIVAACFVNPYGHEAFSLALLHFGRTDPALANLFVAHIPENAPLWSLFGTPQDRLAHATLALGLIAVAMIAIKPRPVRFSQALVAAAMLYLAVRSQRNIVLFFFAVLPLITAVIDRCAAEAAGCGRSKALSWTAAVAGVLLAILSVSAMATHGRMLYDCRAARQLAPFSFPVGSAKYLDRHAIAGTLFNADRHGGYLLWSRYPPHRVFVDTRYAIRPAAYFAEYLALLDEPDLFSGVCRKFGITAAVLPLAPLSRYHPLAAALARDPGWRLVFVDAGEALFVRDSLAPTPEVRISLPVVADSIAAAIAERWRQSPVLAREGRGYFAAFLRAVEAGEHASEGGR
ncbi:MAG: hypothetical protein JXA71_18925 [Chitinispirillaceae bacterium]|nr:hypothetical protein [Chitinispirillaceae bacterium]